MFRIVPDIWIFELEPDFFQFLPLLVVVKDTPEAIRPVISDLLYAGKYDLSPL